MTLLKQKLRRILLLSSTGLIIIGAALSYLQFNYAQSVQAETTSQLRDKVAQIEAQIERDEKKLANIQSDVASLENKLAQLRSEISIAEQRIQLTEAKIAELKSELKKAEAELKRQEGILAENLRTLYIEGDRSTLELLLTAESFGDFFQEQQYLEQLKVTIQESTEEIKQLKKKIEAEKVKQESLLVEIEGQKRALDNKKQEQQRILSQTRGQEARYQDILAENKERMEEVKQQLIASIAASQTGIVYGGTGNYPWANVEPWSFDSCYPDPWGMCKRQCVSYTAYKVHNDYNLGKVRFDMPNWGGYGNAYQWPENARRAGIPTGSTPKVGAIAIDPNVACGYIYSNGTWQYGCYGHAMYVESVLPNGNIWVSQMNAQAQGRYSEAPVNPAGLTFIYFQEW